MTIRMRPYAGAADLQRILALKRACTTPENRYDAPTLSELRALLAPLPPDHRTASVGGRAWCSDSTPLPPSDDPAGDYALGGGGWHAAHPLDSVARYRVYPSFEGETEMEPLSRGTSGAHGMRNEIGFWVLRTWEKRNASSFVFLNGTKTVRSGVYYFGSVLT